MDGHESKDYIIDYIIAILPLIVIAALITISIITIKSCVDDHNRFEWQKNCLNQGNVKFEECVKAYGRGDK